MKQWSKVWLCMILGILILLSGCKASGAPVTVSSRTNMKDEVLLVKADNPLVTKYEHLYSGYDGVYFVHGSVDFTNFTKNTVQIAGGPVAIYNEKGERVKDFAGELFLKRTNESTFPLESGRSYSVHFDFLYTGAGVYQIEVGKGKLPEPYIVELVVEEIEEIENKPIQIVTFNEPFIFNGLELTVLEDYSTFYIQNKDIVKIHGDQPVLKVPVQIRNLTHQTLEPQWSRYDAYTPDKEKALGIGVWFTIDYIGTRRSYEANSTMIKYLFCYAKGDGEYAFYLHSQTEERVHISLPITLPPE